MGKYLVEYVAEALPMTMLCDCSEEGSCTYCMNLANELINNLWAMGLQIVRKEG